MADQEKIQMLRRFAIDRVQHHLTDAQLLEAYDAMKYVVNHALDTFRIMWTSVEPYVSLFITAYENELKRKRRLYYRKKKSQARRRGSK